MINNLKNTRGCFNIKNFFKRKKTKAAKENIQVLHETIEVYHVGKVHHQKICINMGCLGGSVS